MSQDLVVTNTTVTVENSEEIQINTTVEKPLFRTIFTSDDTPLTIQQLEDSLGRYKEDAVLVAILEDKVENVEKLVYFNLFLRVFDHKTGQDYPRKIILRLPEDEVVYHGVPDPLSKEMQGNNKDGAKRSLKIGTKSRFMKTFAILEKYIADKLEPYRKYFGYSKISGSFYNGFISFQLHKGINGKTGKNNCIVVSPLTEDDIAKGNLQMKPLTCVKTGNPIFPDMSNIYPTFSKGILHKLSIIQLTFASGTQGKISIRPKITRAIWTHDNNLEEVVADPSKLSAEEIAILSGEMNELQIEDKKEE